MPKLDEKLKRLIEESLKDNQVQITFAVRKSKDNSGSRGGLPIRKSEELVEGIEDYLRNIAGYGLITREDGEEYHILIL